MNGFLNALLKVLGHLLWQAAMGIFYSLRQSHGDWFALLIALLVPTGFLGAIALLVLCLK
jgi:hypothetical protein